MDGKFLSDKTKDKIVEILDGLKDWGILEPVEKPVYRLVLNQVDRYADKVVPDELDIKIDVVCTLAIDGDYETAAGAAGEILDELINIEKVNDEIEKLVFVDGLKFIVRQLILYIEKKKAA